MKKLIIFTLSLIFCIPCLITPLTIYKNACASDTQVEIKSSFESAVDNFLNIKNGDGFTDRSAGSVGERESARYIVEKMKADAPTFVAYNKGSEKGFQDFSFTDVNGVQKLSQNLIFTRPGSSEHKIIIGVPYNNYYGIEVNQNESISVSGFYTSDINIVTMLELAKYIDKTSRVFDYSIEIVFFGAELYYNTGSEFYLNGIGEKTAKNTILSLYFNDLRPSANLNVFTSEITTKFNSYFVKSMNNMAGEKVFSKFDSFFYTTNLSTINDFPFYHVGLNNFTLSTDELGISSAYIFGGDYLQLPSYDTSLVTTDSYINAKEKYGDCMYDNAIVVVSSLYSYLTKYGTSEELIKYNDYTKNYVLWKDARIAVTITACIIVVLLIVYFFVYDSLVKKFKNEISKNKDKYDMSDVFEKIAQELRNGKINKNNLQERIKELVEEKAKSINENADGIDTFAKTTKVKDDIDKIASENKLNSKAESALKENVIDKNDKLNQEEVTKKKDLDSDENKDDK